jgi:hypothetical protein
LARGIDVKLTIAPGIGHNDIFRARETLAAITELLTMEEVKVTPPARGPASTP